MKLEMDNFWKTDADKFLHSRNHDFTPGLSLLKKLERARLREVQDTIDRQEYEQRFQGKSKSKSLQWGKYWEWQADDGTWQPFEPEEQIRLETAVEMGQKTVPFVDSIHFMHTADLTLMLLVNMKDGNGRKIRRIPVVHSVGQLSKRKNSASKSGWNFAESSDDEGVVGNSTYNNNSIDFLGSRTQLHNVSSLGLSAWSRHRSSSSPSSVAENFAVRDSRFGSTKGADPRKEWKTCRKKVPDKSPRQISMKSNSTNVRRKSNEMNMLNRWLQKVGLEDYYDKFKRERITLREVHRLDEKDLKKLGLPMGARKRFIESAKDLKVGREPPNEYLCPITMMLMKEPVLLSDGFTYEKSAIENWLKGHNKSPMTNGVLESTVLTPNRQLKKLIDDFKAFEG